MAVISGGILGIVALAFASMGGMGMAIYM